MIRGSASASLSCNCDVIILKVNCKCVCSSRLPVLKTSRKTFKPLRITAIFSQGFIGAMDHALLLNVPGAQRIENETECDTSYSGVSMVIFEMTFAILAPAMVLITW